MDPYKSYKLFARTIEIGKFSTVANEAGISQSSVSKNIASLEASLGVQLFSRTTRKLHPTEEALHLYERVRTLLDSIDEIRASGGRDRQSEPTGTLRITAPSSFGRRKILPLLPKFLRSFPKVNVDIVSTDATLDLVTSGLELGIRVGNLPSSTLIARSLGILEFSLVASPTYLADVPRPDSPLDLPDLSCLSYGTRTQWDFESEHGRTRVDVSGRLRVDDYDALYDACISGLGIAGLPSWMVDADLQNGRLISLLEDHYLIPQPISVVYPQTKFLSKRARSFIDFLVSEIRD